MGKPAVGRPAGPPHTHPSPAGRPAKEAGGERQGKRHAAPGLFPNILIAFRLFGWAADNGWNSELFGWHPDAWRSTSVGNRSPQVREQLLGFIVIYVRDEEVRMARRPPASTSSKSRGEGTLSAPRPQTGLTLLVLDSRVDLVSIVLAMRGKGLRPVVAPLAQNVFQIIANWRPRATIVQAGMPQWQELISFVSKRDIPTVVIGDPRQLRRAEELGAVTVGVLSPAQAAEIADAAELTFAPINATGLPDTIDLGSVYIDVRARRVRIEGEDVHLPPKEFDILVQLALRPNEPVSSPELIRRLWPATANTTPDDLHCRVSRLRTFIGDRDRSEPLVSNRRGFGYMLNISSITTDG